MQKIVFERYESISGRTFVARAIFRKCFFSSDFSILVRQKVQERFDECLEKKKNKLIKQPKIVVQVKPSIEKTIVKEFIPQNVSDAILPILREIFVNSFHQYYQEIQNELKLKENKNLREWLHEVFDEMQMEMLERKCRCFMLCSTDETESKNQNQGIIGFLTLEEREQGTVYIAQCAIDARSKQCGYGSRLIQHLREVYPPGTYYWGLCRRANKPAVSFYAKQGAKFIDDKNVADTKGYDSSLYAGFEFTDKPSGVNETIINQRAKTT